MRGRDEENEGKQSSLPPSVQLHRSNMFLEELELFAEKIQVWSPTSPYAMSM